MHSPRLIAPFSLLFYSPFFLLSFFPTIDDLYYGPILDEFGSEGFDFSDRVEEVPFFSLFLLCLLIPLSDDFFSSPPTEIDVSFP